MPVEVKYDNPDFPKGTLFDLSGIAIENGKSVKLDDEAELAFVARHGKAVKDKLGNNEHVTLSGTPKYSAAQVERMYPQPAPLESDNPYVDDTTTKDDEGGESS